ncbi:hypothetical protein B296_00042509 [Ensete ventricosum]|uniref:Uncharacterized protein n=1 Tax=Ensete ventricosum TaxID=4639 RepID=A0A426XBJ2_ENSVE|nr:hypothetical protein B296_00042509 [Ensete ventricosum]
MCSGVGQKFARSWPRFKRCCRELAESSPEVCRKFIGSSLTGCRELTRSSLEGCWEFVGSSPKEIGSSPGVHWQDNGNSDGEDEGGQASSSLAISTRWISIAKLLQSDLTTLAEREGGE